MIATYTIKHPLTFRRNAIKPWAIAMPVVLSILGQFLFNWKGMQIVGLLTIGWGIASLLFLKGRKKKKETVKTLVNYNLHFTPETIELDKCPYALSDVRNLRLDVGHYDGEPVVPKRGVLAVLEGLEVFTGGPAGSRKTYDGSDSHLSFVAGKAKISVSFYIASETHRAQFKSLLKIWYSTGVEVTEFSYGMRTYLLKKLKYAEIQAFKKMYRDTGQNKKGYHAAP